MSLDALASLIPYSKSALCYYETGRRNPTTDVIAWHARCFGGDLDLACDTWSSALDAMGGVRSGRTRTVARDIRAVLEPHRDIPHMRAIDDRAARCPAASTA
ncbi:hypothetical protein NFA_38230 [Nocardia farcinica IFM 10152]|uniref:HTH cro/C1-type domain-containing protein n=2 Tax=Nocardia farcinica TaxID=37329 RepID=Q5YT20_NOCFA|nr:hypothetical protein NFA_38230 [Nocardia farcinica IFM 10152]